MDKKKIEKAVRDILIAVGEDPKRRDIKDTPKRVAEKIGRASCRERV